MEIVFTDPQDVYFTGNKVSGYVRLAFRNGTQVKGATLKVCGVEHSCYAARKMYFDYMENKMKSEAGNWMGGVRYHKFLEVDLPLSGAINFDSGPHELPFSFPLPKDLPMSYQGKYGFVRYYTKVEVDLLNGKDYKEEKDFEVESFIDFNECISELQMKPIIYQKEKSVGFCCCPGGPITIDLRLEKIAFVLGEVAKIMVDVNNLSDERIAKLDVKLTRTVKSRLEQRQRDFFRYQHEVLTSYVDTGLEAKQQRTYDFGLKIPRSAILYNFKRCIFLSQWFTLSVAAVLPGDNSVTLETKVELGHIPLGGA